MTGRTAIYVVTVPLEDAALKPLKFAVSAMSWREARAIAGIAATAWSGQVGGSHPVVERATARRYPSGVVRI